MSLGPIKCDRFNCKRRNQIGFNSYISTHVMCQTKHKLYIHTHEVTALILIFLINWLIPEIAQTRLCTAHYIYAIYIQQIFNSIGGRFRILALQTYVRAKKSSNIIVIIPKFLLGLRTQPNFQFII